MTTAQFTTYAGVGEWAKDNLHYSQAVRIGNIVKISGQGQSDPNTLQPIIIPVTDFSLGGWNPSADLASPSTWFSSDLDTEIDQAFANVELALKAAGSTGWSEVYSVRSYHLPLDERVTSAMVRNSKQWCGPDHRPIWTEIGVASLGLDGMRVEIEVEAFIK